MKFPIRLGKFKSTRILAGASGLLLALTLVAAFITPVSAVPQPSHQFFGTVYIDSVPAPEGTEVVARIANVTQNFPTAVAANHTYGWSPAFYVLADDPDTAEKEGGSDGDTIEFYVAGTWATNFTFKSGAYNELNLSVGVITHATLEGHVTFLRNKAAGDPTWVTPLVGTFFDNATKAKMVWSPVNVTTDAYGNFTIPGIDPGTYDIGIKNCTCLSEMVFGIELTAGNTTYADFGTSREGDCNEDDMVNSQDRGLLYDGWNSFNVIQDGHLCDLNRDGWLNSEDRGLMYANWNQLGDLV